MLEIGLTCQSVSHGCPGATNENTDVTYFPGC
jgi:hypothetical protein